MHTSTRSCNFFLKLLSMTICISWPSFMTKWVTIQKISSKIYSTKCANSHHDDAICEVDGMVQNIKNLNAWRTEKDLPWNNKTVKLCLNDYHFISCHISTEVTLKDKMLHRFCKNMLEICPFSSFLFTLLKKFHFDLQKWIQKNDFVKTWGRQVNLNTD